MLIFRSSLRVSLCSPTRGCPSSLYTRLSRSRPQQRLAPESLPPRRARAPRLRETPSYLVTTDTRAWLFYSHCMNFLPNLRICHDSTTQRPRPLRTPRQNPRPHEPAHASVPNRQSRSSARLQNHRRRRRPSLPKQSPRARKATHLGSQNARRRRPRVRRCSHRSWACSASRGPAVSLSLAGASRHRARCGSSACRARRKERRSPRRGASLQTSRAHCPRRRTLAYGPAQQAPV